MYNKFEPVSIEYPDNYPTGPIIYKFSRFAQNMDLDNSSFIKVASEALNSSDFNSEEKQELSRTIWKASKEGILDKTSSEVIQTLENARQTKEPAYNTPWFWSLAIIFVGCAIFGIIIASFLLSQSGSNIPEFFSTSIGALIGVLVSLFAGWSQSK
jgi:hypothetical protein